MTSQGNLNKINQVKKDYSASMLNYRSLNVLKYVTINYNSIYNSCTVDTDVVTSTN